ncbi:hypothetical protein QVD17_17919 [Tagetes erecta]|uniref:Receptor-like serine/threonine-protein kinase n=1 Tax=Tagetes erecta TaxID=13708 RepID=A0AAD8KJI7_TARER|nr:hypothetical protein QVD17_17919 [Tagetes erecta]
MKNPQFQIIIFILCFFSPVFSITTDTITPTKPLTINQTLVSNQQVFELGFFNPGNNKLYIGIWYKKISPKTIVWVANRDSPVFSSSGKLTIGDNGNLILLNEAETVVWTSNQSVPVGNTVAKLLDTGNFVVRPENDENPANYIWESFNHPTSSLLPGMKLGWDRKTGVNRFLQSWKTCLDPGSGKYLMKMNMDGFPEIVILKNETEMKTVYRSGPWNGKTLSGVPEIKSASSIDFKFVNNYNEIYYAFEMMNSTIYSRILMRTSGSFQRLMWNESAKTWSENWVAPRDQCDEYKKCGSFGICDGNVSSVCKCMKGFRPRNQQAWDVRNGSDGCVRSSKMDCDSDGFLRLKNMKLPESLKGYVNQTLSLSECAKICKRNCSCVAYASTDIIGSGLGCVIWIMDLLDMRQYADFEGGQDLYVRVSASDMAQSPDHLPIVRTSENGSSNNVVKIIPITVGIIFTVLIVSLILFYMCKKKMKQSKIHSKGQQNFLMNEGVIVPVKRDYYCGDTKSDELELPLFHYTTLVKATNNFSDVNKLGQGGFGVVYKGILMEGQVVAVKRLSKTSGQGIEELKNEVRLIAKLQHRNLVRLVGCCIETEEKLLVYEYMEHKSLDMFLFDKQKSAQLDWQKRFDIIIGIARGLLYLHQDSRFKIIHRDLKVSNILLDKNKNPKVSDFGLARIFGGDETEAETKKVVGTRGYMSPEYAMDGLFSIKSDVFSFGVLTLEIVSGKRNRGFYSESNPLNLIGHTWNLWREENALELLDESIRGEFSQDEVLRCIQIGLLCVQEHANDRPSMPKVLLMLSSDDTVLPQPKYPGFCLGSKEPKKEPSGQQDESLTLNKVSITILEGR